MYEKIKVLDVGAKGYDKKILKRSFSSYPFGCVLRLCSTASTVLHYSPHVGGIMFENWKHVILELYTQRRSFQFTGSAYLNSKS